MNRIPVEPNFIAFTLDGKERFLHLECRRLGWVVCAGKTEGTGMSEAFRFKQEAARHMRFMVDGVTDNG